MRIQRGSRGGERRRAEERNGDKEESGKGKGKQRDVTERVHWRGIVAKVHRVPTRQRPRDKDRGTKSEDTGRQGRRERNGARKERSKTLSNACTHAHLVGHGRRSNLSSLGLLLEQTLRDVGPDIAAKVDKDGVDAPAEGSKHSSSAPHIPRSNMMMRASGGCFYLHASKRPAMLS